MDDLQERLIVLGFTDKVLNGWKLKLYHNIDESVKYYKSDSFCFEYFIFGDCKMQHSSFDKHKFTATQLLTIDIGKCIIILEYLEWYYKEFNDLVSVKYQSKMKTTTTFVKYFKLYWFKLI